MVNIFMFIVTKEDLAYEKILRLMEADEQVEEGVDETQAAPTQQSQPAMDPSQMTPEQVYQAGLDDIKKTIEETGRKRYQKYKLDGGKDTYAMFKKNMETQLKDDLDKEMKEQYGGIPGQESEKELLAQIRNTLNDIKALNGGTPNQPVPQAAPQPQGDVQAQEDTAEQPEEGIEDEQTQQPMQESHHFMFDRDAYRNEFKELFDSYFNN